MIVQRKAIYPYFTSSEIVILTPILQKTDLNSQRDIQRHPLFAILCHDSEGSTD